MNLIHMHKYLIIMQNYWNNLPHKHLLLNLQAHTHRTQVTLRFTDITTNAGIFRTNRRNLCVLQLASQQMQQIFPCSTRFWSTKCSKSSRALPAFGPPTLMFLPVWPMMSCSAISSQLLLLILSFSIYKNKTLINVLDINYNCDNL